MKTLACTLLLTLIFAPGSAPAVQREDVAGIFAPWIGDWHTAEGRQTAGGQHFRYGFKLDWFDDRKTIVRMTISRKFEDGKTSLSWEGFKGFDPASQGLYYYGFSPSGRMSRGEVRIAEDGSMVTSYTGYGPDGTPVEIRDISAPVADDRFTTVTTLRRKADEPWREIGRDTWMRVTGE